MFGFFNKKQNSKVEFDKWVLRKNDITLLILDERWNKLFTNAEKPQGILKCESELKDLLKLRAKLTEELKEIQKQKKDLMAQIISLTTEAFENNSEAAKQKMQECEKEIKKINDRLEKLPLELEEMPERLKAKNLELLQVAVEEVYISMRKKQKRVMELERLIEETREILKGYIEEKGTIAQDNTDVYSYFHDLLGSEEIEKLDKVYLSE